MNTSPHSPDHHKTTPGGQPPKFLDRFRYYLYQRGFAREVGET